ncbi:hypothetical protein [Streptomyces sp. NPDC094149]|uniref:hypothetical protein n=1 Tax=Streptomyces sp. NPDC094149 TaxID=3155079 RepID=UPI00331FACFD
MIDLERATFCDSTGINLFITTPSAGPAAGDRQWGVEADVCLHTRGGLWGFSAACPADLVRLPHEADEVFLRLDPGHKCPIRSLNIPILQPSEGAYASAPFIGDDAAPGDPRTRGFSGTGNDRSSSQE